MPVTAQSPLRLLLPEDVLESVLLTKGDGLLAETDELIAQFLLAVGVIRGHEEKTHSVVKMSGQELKSRGLFVCPHESPCQTETYVPFVPLLFPAAFRNLLYVWACQFVLN